MKARPENRKAEAEPATKLLVAMTGKASAAKPAEGGEPVFADIASCRNHSARSPAAVQPDNHGLQSVVATLR